MRQVKSLFPTLSDEVTEAQGGCLPKFTERVQAELGFQPSASGRLPPENIIWFLGEQCLAKPILRKLLGF